MKFQFLFSLEIFREGIFLKLPKKFYKLFFQNKNILFFMLKNGPRGKCLQERSYYKKLSNTPLIYGDSFILL